MPRLVREGRVKLFISTATVNEFRSVILRPHIFSRLPGATFEQVEAFAAEIVFISQFVEIVPVKYRFDRDPKDEIIIDLAIECGAEYIVTRDNDILDLVTGIDLESKQFRQRFRVLKIVRPDELLRTIAAIDLSLEP